MTFKVGLTGGIGSGKSTVARLFGELGVPVIDADVAARAVAAPGSPVLRDIAALFGGDLVAGGTLQRDRLRAEMFGDPEKRKRLEALLHPLIRRQIGEELRKVDAPYCILCVPLLIEAGWQDLVDGILVVDASEADQVSRTMKRDGLTAAEVEAIMRCQVSRQARLAEADEIIRNDGDVGNLRMQVKYLHGLYLKKAGAPGGIAGSA